MHTRKQMVARGRDIASPVLALSRLKCDEQCRRCARPRQQPQRVEERGVAQGWWEPADRNQRDQGWRGRLHLSTRAREQGEGRTGCQRGRDGARPPNQTGESRRAQRHVDEPAPIRTLRLQQLTNSGSLGGKGDGRARRGCGQRMHGCALEQSGNGHDTRVEAVMKWTQRLVPRPSPSPSPLSHV